MLFNSFSFIVYFIVVTALYYAFPFKLRWLLLFVASCIFYMYFIPVYILILLGTILVDYFAGILIENAKSPRRRKQFLILSLVANIGVLAFFKYFNFFVENINQIGSAIGWNYSIGILKFILPIGLSFHTFQAMSYTLEVYRGNQQAERHLGIYALYVMYYPQLVAGPIERPQNILPQLHVKHAFNASEVMRGLKQMLIGFFKKMVIADNIAQLINPVYEHPHWYSGMSVLAAVMLFAFQIFCDFSGYSDIAIGASRVMGIELMQNFKAPFLSSSVTEFWRRWHISLSTWFNDYVFTPFITAKRDWGKWAIIAGLFITFFLSGFWHGAGWTFIIYGSLHGVALIIEFATKKNRKKLSGSVPSWLYLKAATVLTFLFVCFSWIFFRVQKMGDCIYLAKQMLIAVPQYVMHAFARGGSLLRPFILNPDIGPEKVLAVFAALGILMLGEYADYQTGLIRHLDNRKMPLRWAYYSALVYMILFFGVFHNQKEFIYFQF